MFCTMVKTTWALDDAIALLAGTETMAALMRNSRTVRLAPAQPPQITAFIEQVAAWAEDNITHLCVLDRRPVRQCVRVFFEEKTDLAKFLLVFADYQPDQTFPSP